MFDVRLYYFTKKTNSTKRPNTVPVNTQCLIKTTTSVLNPILVIEENKNYNVFDFNYCYIPELRRYYFIEDIVYNLGNWNVYCKCDVLATHAKSIRNSEQFIIRSTDRYNGNILDSFYNTVPIPISNDESPIVLGADIKNNYRVYEYWLGDWNYVNWFDRSDMSLGFVIAGILSSYNFGVTYYFFDMRAWSHFIGELNKIKPDDMQGIPEGLARAVFDPIQYILSARWYPVVPFGVGSSGGNIDIGGININIPAGYAVGSMGYSSCVREFKTDLIALAQHPQANNTDMQYLKQSPYTEYVLYLEPWGVIPIDPLKIYPDDIIQLVWALDYSTGSARLNVLNSQGAIIETAYAQAGVDMPVSKVMLAPTTLNMGLIAGQGLLSSASDLANKSGIGVSLELGGIPILQANNSYITDNLNTLSNIVDGLVNIQKTVKQTGAVGSQLPYITTLYAKDGLVEAIFRKQIDHNPAKFGRPYMQTDSLNSFYNFVACGNSYIATWSVDNEPEPFKTEQEEVYGYMNSGFFMED